MPSDQNTESRTVQVVTEHILRVSDPSGLVPENIGFPLAEEPLAPDAVDIASFGTPSGASGVVIAYLGQRVSPDGDLAGTRYDIRCEDHAGGRQLFVSPKMDGEKNDVAMTREIFTRLKEFLRPEDYLIWYALLSEMPLTGPAAAMVVRREIDRLRPVDDPLHRRQGVLALIGGACFVQVNGRDVSASDAGIGGLDPQALQALIDGHTLAEADRQHAGLLEVFGRLGLGPDDVLDLNTLSIVFRSPEWYGNLLPALVTDLKLRGAPIWGVMGRMDEDPEVWLAGTRQDYQIDWRTGFVGYYVSPPDVITAVRDGALSLEGATSSAAAVLEGFSAWMAGDVYRLTTDVWVKDDARYQLQDRKTWTVLGEEHARESLVENLDILVRQQDAGAAPDAVMPTP